ncbi:glycosyltransferase [Lewinella sp. 4G2]|uniref:glycosyltransferase n=1 Tax=Lewinella sp. 4G2 TaxID=1803372 RepID=UPI0007B49F6E|nr:glycosyltransferase [Lewinella sp. 4G2]OAV43186.1 hypothetical protein A3850_001150 [Lewinella sp. 4G2]
MKIAILGNYPPKACGIATFTNSLARAILSNLTTEEIADYAEIIAIEDAGQHHHYPKEVGTILPRDERAAYGHVADYLNTGGFDLLIVQHEYGIFGGPDGNYLLDLVDRLRIPLMVTCHTVLKNPSEGQCSVMRRLCVRAGVMVVMSRMAKTFLIDVCSCPANRIQVIEHGVPVIETAPREELRERFGWARRRVLFTFGLLGRGKGIETVIRSLPAIVAEHPETLYVVLGKTHPNVVREHGEEYREWLHELADELGVKDNLHMISEFASEQYLFECLRATDLYVIPYPNEAQICSGTLAYAVGAGAAVVSTPFWHATELLADGRGRLFPFHDSDALACEVKELLGKPDVLQDIRAKALAYGDRLFWPKIGAEYIKAFADAQMAYERSSRNRSTSLVPKIKLDHLLRMTDDCGIIQHAKYATPNRHEGYCLDDNGRALLFTSMALSTGRFPKAERKILTELSETYLSYIFHAQHEDGTFSNFMSYGREFLDDQGSEDSYGRALWGLAACITANIREDLTALAQECFIRAIGHLDRRTSPRTLSYGIIALSEYLGEHDDENLRNLLDRSVNRLLDHHRDSRYDDWDWFEPYLTYDNGLMPLALYRSLRILPKNAVQSVAESTTDFLVQRTILGNIPRPVGCHAVCHRGEAPQQFDQQPLEVMADTLLYLDAYAQGRMDKDEKLARTVYGWFHGNNDLAVKMYCSKTGGCYDGLTATGPNKNQGAESLLAYLIATLAIQQLPIPRPTFSKSKRGTLKKMLNGFAPAWVESIPSAPKKTQYDAPTLVSATAARQYDGFGDEGFDDSVMRDHPFLSR